MGSYLSTSRGIVILVCLVGLGMGVLVWLSPVPEGQITPAQQHLITLSDMMVKGAIGAIFGFVGGRSLSSR